jgi:SAM-dependent methyltransferase
MDATAYADYYRADEGGSFSESDAEDQARLQSARGEIAFILDSIPRGEVVSAVDVGSGNGHFLVALRDAGCTNVIGLEPSIDAAQRCRAQGFDVRTTTLEQSDLGVKVDLVTLSAVLEHLVDPAQLVLDIRNLLRPGGYVYVRIPDLMSLRLTPFHPVRCRLRKVFKFVHLSYFSERTIARFVGRLGYRPVVIKVVPPDRASPQGEIRAVFADNHSTPVEFPGDSPAAVKWYVFTRTLVARPITFFFDVGSGLRRRLKALTGRDRPVGRTPAP